MSSEGEIKAKNTKYNLNNDWAGSNENVEKSWRQESTNWQQTYRKKVRKKKEKKPQSYDLQNIRRSLMEVKIAEVEKATILADEAVEGLKAVFLKLCGGIIPDGETIFKKYIEEIVNAAAEYIFDASKINNIVKQFFNNARNIGRVDVFARIGNWWQKIITDRKIQADEKIAREREKILEKERLLEEMKLNEQEKEFERQNQSLVKKLESKIKKLEVDMPDKWKEIKESLESEQGRSLTDRETRKVIKEKAHDDIRQLVIENDISLNAKERNESLKNNLDIVSKAKNVKDVLKAFETTYSFPVCPICHMPAIPSTPCIVRF